MSTARRGAVAMTVDQIVCGASNFALMLLAIRALEIREVGAFTLAFTVLVLAVAAVRALLCEPLLLGYAAAPGAVRRAATDAAAGAALLVGVALAVVAAGAGGLAAGTTGDLLLAGAVVLPALLLQDVCRFGFFAADRPWRAAGNDAACLVVTVGVALVLLDPNSGPATPLLCWGLGAAAAAVIGLTTGRIVPARGSVRYLLDQRSLGLPLAGSVLVGQGAGRLSLAVIALTSGVVALGLFSTALAILSPVNTFLTAAGSFTLGEAARRRAAGTRGLLRFLAAVSAALGVLVAVATVAAFLLFGSAVAVVFGDVPAGVRTLLWPAGAWALGTALAVGALTGLRVLSGARGILRGTAALGVAQVLAAAAGGMLAGAAGSCWGAAVLALLGAAHWWRACLTAARQPLRSSGTTSTLPEQPRRGEALHIGTTRGMA
ncbi:MAG: hypothetical protein ACT4QF_12500 [Sporichthyaceae bacterium]